MVMNRWARLLQTKVKPLILGMIHVKALPGTLSRYHSSSQVSTQSKLKLFLISIFCYLQFDMFASDLFF